MSKKTENDIPAIEKRYTEARAAINAQIEELEHEIRRLEAEIWGNEGYTGETSIMDGMSDSATAQLSTLKAKKDYRDTRILYTTLMETRYSDAMEAYNANENSNNLHRLSREVYRAEHYLPAYLHRLEFENAVRSQSRFVVVRGELGSGKSTQLPQYLADMPEFSDRIIMCTQPRRIAAEKLANRVSIEYQTEWAAIFVPSDQITDQSRIYYCSEAHFLSILTSKGGDDDATFFQKVGAVVVDEAHERSVYTDVILGLLKTKPFCSHIKVVVTSASLDQEKFCGYLDRCPLISIPGAMFPVRVEYTQLETNFIHADIVMEALKQVLKIINFDPPGDVLCFLTGQEEVERAKSMLSQQSKEDVISLCLYSRQPPKETDEAFLPTPLNHRKVIFATDVAETSLTIEGLSYVVDMGLCKSPVYDAERKTTSLRVIPISQSSADQRKGRVGRTKPGVCYRMFSKTQFEGFEKEKRPEILRRPLDVASALLLSLDVNPFDFPWLDPPDDANLLYSFHLLKTHKAVDQDVQPPDLPSNPSSVLTELGHRVVLLQMGAGLVAGIDYAERQGFLEAGLILASLAEHGDRTLYSGGAERQKARDCHLKLIKPGGDLVTYFDIFLQWRSMPGSERPKWCLINSINNKTMNAVDQNVNEMRKKLKLVDSSAQTSLEIKQKIILSMSKDNLAVQLRPDEYLVFCLETTDHPQQSVLGRLYRSSLLESPNEAKWVTFHSLFTTNQTYLMQVTPVTLDMVTEVCGRQYAELMERLENENKIVHRVIHQISPKIQTELLGQHGNKKASLINRLQCHDIENSPEELTLKVWATVAEISSVEKELLKSIKMIKSDLLRQIEPINIPRSDVTVVFGAGLKVVEILLPNMILFESLPVTLDEKDLESILSQSLKQSDTKKMIEDLVRSDDYNGATITFSSISVAECVNEALKQENSALLAVLGGKWIPLCPSQSRKPSLRELEIGFGLQPATSCRAGLGDYEKAEKFHWRPTKKKTVNKDWRGLCNLPRLTDGEQYVFYIDLPVNDGDHNEYSVRSAMGSLQPDWVVIFRTQKDVPVNIEINPYEIFPPILKNYLRDARIPFPLRYFQPHYDEKRLWFSVKIGPCTDVDTPSGVLDHLKQELSTGFIGGVKIFSPSIIPTFSILITLPDELVYARKDLLTDVLNCFKEKSYYNSYEEKDHQGYVCRSDKMKYLETLQNDVTLQVCKPHDSISLSPNPAETELGRHLIHRLQSSLRNFTFQPRNSVVHVWAGTEAEVCSLRTELKSLEQSLNEAKEMRSWILPVDENYISTYLNGACKPGGILHFEIKNNMLRVWAPPAAMKQIFQKLQQNFFVTLAEPLILQKPSNSLISAATSSCESIQPNNCSLCQTRLTDQEFMTLDICAHRFHSECLSQHIALASGREPICCPCYDCKSLLTYHELVKISKTKPYGDIKELAIGFYLKSHKKTVIACPGATCSNIIKLRYEYETLVAWCYSCDQIYCFSCAPEQSVVHTSSNPCKMSDYALTDAIAKELCPICTHAFHGRGHPCSNCPCEGHYTYPKPKPSQHSQPPGRDDDRAVPSSSNVQSTPTQNTQQNVPTSSSSPPANQNSRTPPPLPSPPPQPPQSKENCTLL